MTLEQLQQWYPKRARRGRLPQAATGWIPLGDIQKFSIDIKDIKKEHKLKVIYRGPRPFKGLHTRAEHATHLVLYP